MQLSRCSACCSQRAHIIVALSVLEGLRRQAVELKPGDEQWHHVLVHKFQRFLAPFVSQSAVKTGWKERQPDAWGVRQNNGAIKASGVGNKLCLAQAQPL